MGRTAGGAESNSDTERNREGSSAIGRHQFIPNTFVDNYHRTFPNSHETPPQILTHLTDGSTQDAVMRNRMERGRDMLVDANMPVTPGALYLMHVAELPRGLHAMQHLDEPITTRFSPREIQKNHWHSDWTNADLLHWAEGRMEPPAQRSARQHRPAPRAPGPRR
jgi:hypothetical protein